MTPEMPENTIADERNIVGLTENGFRVNLNQRGDQIELSEGTAVGLHVAGVDVEVHTLPDAIAVGQMYQKATLNLNGLFAPEVKIYA